MFAERPSVSTAVEEKTQRTSSAVVTAPPSVGTKTAEQPVYDFIKRVCDVFCSFFGLVVLSPFFLLVSLMIKLERSGKGVFFKQKRLGKNGKYI